MRVTTTFIWRQHCGVKSHEIRNFPDHWFFSMGARAHRFFMLAESFKLLLWQTICNPTLDPHYPAEITFA